MQTFLVGGAVRDKLLELPVTDRDWVVVAASPTEMLNAGYQQVGKDFPVFLHPKTKEEYALARTERKAGRGYTGFVCDASKDVTLEQDLLRRDLTINAIAEDSDGQLIDPYGGLNDLRLRVLRHVSPAFSEDPLRVLRVARFAARYAYLGFTVAPETNELMREVAKNGELQTLPAERVWQEVHKSLLSASPDEFIRSLRNAGALATILPEVDALFGVPQTATHHPEVDTGEHMILVMQQAVRLQLSPAARYAALLHDLGKGTTPPSEWPRHIGHEGRSKKMAAKVSKRLKVPSDFASTAGFVAEFHLHSHRALELSAKTLLKLFQSLDAYRRPSRVEDFVMACEADARGRTGFEQREYPQANYLREAFLCCRDVDVQALQAEGYSGQQLGEQIKAARLGLLKAFVATQRKANSSS